MQKQNEVLAAFITKEVQAAVQKALAQPATTDRLIDVKEAAHLAGCGVSTVWRNSKAGTFPKPIVLGANMTRWRLSEVNKWIQDPLAWVNENGEGA